MRLLGALFLLMPSAAPPAVQAIVATPSAISITEGTSGIVTVTLAQDPGPLTSVVITPGISSGGMSATWTPAQITLTGGAGGTWSSGEPLTINVPHDADLDDESATITLFAVGLPTVSVIVTLLDDDRPAGAPTASITLPKHGDVVTGTTEDFSGTWTDDVAVTLVEWFADGVLISSQATPPSPCHVNGAPSMWNTTALSNGIHTLRMTVTDGTTSISHQIDVTVSNGSTGGGSSGGGCGALGIEPLLLLLLLRLRRR